MNQKTPMTEFETKLINSLERISEDLSTISIHLVALDADGELIGELVRLGDILNESNRIVAKSRDMVGYKTFDE
jgi:hypothetical protein